MKRIICSILLFILTITVLCGIYIFLFDVSLSALAVLLVILALYGFAMGMEEKSIRELKKYEMKATHAGLTEEDGGGILQYCVTALSSAYFCVFLVSLVPLYTYEIWFITVLPCILLNCLPASAVLDEYYCLTRKKAPFLAIFLSITAACWLIGTVIGSVVLKQVLLL